MNATSRRNFLQTLTGTALASLLHRDASAGTNPLSAKAAHHPAQARAVIQIFCPGGPAREVSTINRGTFTLSDTMAEPQGYLAITQTRDGRLQLLTSKNHYVFNLTWIKALPSGPKK